ncbi:sulfate ABC transporter substrate-binding protein [filamentous cyanobacterium CCP1]|nr:sulfate ABC transporter substrate-binding protein [filamentous cyanobacterium CCP2]PSB68263.1 sulfate ABC transporter substrate-binding protein [filamentous cyanobacterium CCP1]
MARFELGRLKPRSLRGFVALFLSGVAMCFTLAACAPTSETASTEENGAAPAQAGTANLTLVSYAVTQAAYEQIIPKFAAQWKAEHNQDVVFDQSYGGSGSQTRAVIDGLEADVVALALALDTKKIEDAGLINAGWEGKTPNSDGIVHRSVAVLVTREGNPKNIQGWQDLAKDDVQVITANPKTSGGARWNFMALWGAVTENGGNETQAEEFTKQVFENVPVLPKDAREATDIFFAQGQGDVLINYENEALLAEEKGEGLPFVLPTDINISIDNPVAVVDANVDKHGTREVAEAFVQFLFTPEAQEEFAKAGFRPVDESVAQRYTDKYPAVENLFTVNDLGGWDEVQTKFFDDGATFDQILAEVGRA